ncbi:acetate--CoA ligase family protein [Acidobacteriota bacterium]
MKINFAAINNIFQQSEGSILLEHEVYRILREAGIRTPEFLFVEKDKEVSEKDLTCFKVNRLVLKVVSPLIIHKTDVGGTCFIPNNIDAVNQCIKQMMEEIPGKYKEWADTLADSEKKDTHSVEDIKSEIRGVLICEAVDYERERLGSELLLGLRTSREFGPIVTLSLGGLDVEYLDEIIKEGRALSIGSAHLLEKKDIPDMLKPLAFFDKLTGQSRGRKALIAEDEMADPYSRFLELAAYYSAYESNSEYVIEEAEINPLVISQGKLVALDAMCRISKKHLELKSRPFENIKYLLRPQSIGIIGVSEKMNLGHIILNNVLKNGFLRKNVFVVKPDIKEIEGCLCVPSVSALPESVDLFVLTVSSEQSGRVMEEIIQAEKARSVIVIAGGIGEKEGTEDIERNIRALLSKGRSQGKLTPVVNGGNCLGIFSRPGKYDTTFVPDYKLYHLPRSHVKKTGLVHLSQSGAFMVSRMSKLPFIEPLYAVSIGNQIDLTIADYLNYLKHNKEAKIFAVYAEGFLPGDGMVFARAVEEITRQPGKAVLVYKAGRTPEGKAATSSHTHSVAGDYRVSRKILEECGAIMAEDIFEFENYIKGLSFLGEKKIRGNRIGLISNAGFECVVMSDNLKDEAELRLGRFSPQTVQRLSDILKPLGIDRLQDIHNPLDITPVADDRSFCLCVQAVLEDENIDAAVVSPVPMTPEMQTLAPSCSHQEDLYQEGSTPKRLVEIFHQTDKPFVVSIDSGPIYQPMKDLLERNGIPVFWRCDDAVRFLRKFVSSFFKKINTSFT